MKMIGFFSILFLSVVSHAQIGPAGCGLGNVIFKDQDQVIAATTNGSSGSQTFGITSGTSNCVDSSTRAQLQNYIEVNKVALNKEAARGQGNTLSGLNTVLKCSGDISPVIKDHYKQIFSTENSAEISAKIMTVVENNKSTCRI